MAARSQPRPASSAAKAGHLQLVAHDGRLVDPGFIPRDPVWVQARPRPGERTAPQRPPSAAPARAAAPRPAPLRSAAPAPGRARGQRAKVRLTRRGRLVIASAVVLAVAAAVMAAASTARTAGHQQPTRPMSVSSLRAGRLSHMVDHNI